MPNMLLNDWVGGGGQENEILAKIICDNIPWSLNHCLKINMFILNYNNYFKTNIDV